MTTPTTQADDNRPRAARHVDTGGPVTAPDIDTLVRAHQAWLIRFVSTQVRRGDGALADDLVQVTYLRAWRALQNARLESVEAERAWLATIARHAVADHYLCAATRQRAREDATDPTDATAWPTDGHAIDDDIDRLCTVIDLTRSMGAATAEHRRVVALRLTGETSWTSLAGITRQGRGTVRRLAAEATAGVIG